MNTNVKYFAILALLPLFSVALVGSMGSVETLQGQDARVSKLASDSTRVVCGDRLCSEISGGVEAWRESMKGMYTIGSDERQTTPQESETGEKKEMQDRTKMHDKMKDKMHDKMDEKMHDKEMKDRMSDKMDDKMTDKMMKDESKYKHKDAGSLLKLSRANVPATIPLHLGYYDGGNVYFIITDSSDPTHAEIITESQGWKVELAPPLKNAPDSALSRTYMFTNGIEGAGVHGYQGEVFTSTPAQPDVYSALTSHVHVTWNDAENARTLVSEQEIIDAEAAGEVTLVDLEVVLNMPHIVWPEGQMVVKEDKTLTDSTPYGGGQVLDINTDEMTVTFIAHRGWGPDGRTIYYIVTDATPSGPAMNMGVVDAPTAADLLASSAAVDLFQFKNGIKGSGPLGFQPGIASAALGDETYSPMWRIFVIGWNDPSSASVLETRADIDAFSKAEMISTSLARPMDSDHIVNCPFIDPFQ